MGAFEFDSKADLSARSCNFCGNGSNESNGRNEETCIIVQKIFDQCRIQKCLGSSILRRRPCRKERNPQLQRYALRGRYHHSSLQRRRCDHPRFRPDPH